MRVRVRVGVRVRVRVRVKVRVTVRVTVTGRGRVDATHRSLRGSHRERRARPLRSWLPVLRMQRGTRP